MRINVLRLFAAKASAKTVTNQGHQGGEFVACLILIREFYCNLWQMRAGWNWPEAI
jgi:hypothetical protein